MNKHNHKEPPLREQVNHTSSKKSNFAYWVSMACFALVFALMIAAVFE